MAPCLKGRGIYIQRISQIWNMDTKFESERFAPRV